MTKPEVPDISAIIECLERYQVKFVVIGALAAILQGVEIERTLDVDITPASDDKNKSRLARALKEMGAKLRLPPPEYELEIPLDDLTFRQVETMTFITRFGPLDVLFRPSGTDGFDDLNSKATTVGAQGVTLRVISIEDVVRCKQAAGREKDNLHLLAIQAFIGRSG